jgi:WD40 repeat protein
LTSIQGRVVELCSKRLAFGAEITSIAWDRANEATFRLATGTRDQCVQLWSFNGKEVHEIFSRQLASTIPKNIDFMENHAVDLYVFGIYDGHWYAHHTLAHDLTCNGSCTRHVLSSIDGTVITSRELNKVM